jgi:hypothetical protein
MSGKSEILPTGRWLIVILVTIRLRNRAARRADTATLFQTLGGNWWNRIELPAESVLNVGTDQAATIVDDTVALPEK